MAERKPVLDTPLRLLLTQHSPQSAARYRFYLSKYRFN
jgi:hypothetical protein